MLTNGAVTDRQNDKLFIYVCTRIGTGHRGIYLLSYPKWGMRFVYSINSTAIVWN